MDEDRRSSLEWRPEDIYVIRNEDMMCANCKSMIANHGSDCEKYSQKPRYVMDNEKECPEFEKPE